MSVVVTIRMEIAMALVLVIAIAKGVDVVTEEPITVTAMRANAGKGYHDGEDDVNGDGDNEL